MPEKTEEEKAQDAQFENGIKTLIDRSKALIDALPTKSIAGQITLKQIAMCQEALIKFAEGLSQAGMAFRILLPGGLEKNKALLQEFMDIMYGITEMTVDRVRRECTAHPEADAEADARGMGPNSMTRLIERAQELEKEGKRPDEAMKAAMDESLLPSHIKKDVNETVDRLAAEHAGDEDGFHLTTFGKPTKKPESEAAPNTLKPQATKQTLFDQYGGDLAK